MRAVNHQRLCALLMTLLPLSGCGSGHTAQKNSDEQLLRDVKQFTVTPRPPWPSYLARDYAERGQPRLTNQQRARIRRTIAVVRPCQLAFLRYAFPDPHYAFPEYGGMVLFFEPTTPSEWPHVLWERNIYYKPLEGEAFPASDAGFSPDYSIQKDIRDRGCQPP